LGGPADGPGIQPRQVRRRPLDLQEADLAHLEHGVRGAHLVEAGVVAEVVHVVGEHVRLGGDLDLMADDALLLGLPGPQQRPPEGVGHVLLVGVRRAVAHLVAAPGVVLRMAKGDAHVLTCPPLHCTGWTARPSDLRAKCARSISAWISRSRAPISSSSRESGVRPSSKSGSRSRPAIRVASERACASAVSSPMTLSASTRRSIWKATERGFVRSPRMRSSAAWSEESGPRPFAKRRRKVMTDSVAMSAASVVLPSTTGVRSTAMTERSSRIV